MKKIGIDLGSASLGWIITDNGSIIRKGVIRFGTGMSKGKSGGYVSPTRDRRDFRSRRNLLLAKKYRKWDLLKILVEGNFVPLTRAELETWKKYKKGHIRRFPENETFQKWLACNFTYERGIKYKHPYELRAKGLEYKISKHEFGRALYHLVQRRGYKDIGETDSETEKQKARRGGESGFENALNRNDDLISKALLNEFLNKNKRARDQYPYRGEYNYELEKLCEAQGYDVSKNNDIDRSYSDEFVKKLWRAIIWQRELKSQKGNIGKCTLEPKKLRCPVSHPVFEIFRTWSFINTIKFYDEDDKKFPVPLDVKNRLFEFFLKKEKNFKFEEIRVFLDKQFQGNKRYNYPTDKDEKYDTSVSGMPVCKGLIDVFGEKVRNAIDSIDTQNITRRDKCGGFGNAHAIITNYSIFDLWHILFAFDLKSAKNQNFLTTFAKEKLNITDEKQVGKFVKLKDKFSQGYADLSVNAMCRIIPFLKEGYLYNEAVVLAKMPEVLGENWRTEKSKVLAAVKEANNVYEWNKTIVGITNNLINKYKGLKDDEIYAFKDFQYTLNKSDITEIFNTTQGYFGEKSWKKRTDKDNIIEAVKQEYQEFFHDEKRAYREFPTLTDIFSGILKKQNVDIDIKRLYHHSNTENRYLKKSKTEKETEKPILPKAKNKYGFNVDVLPGIQIDNIKNPMFNKSMTILRKLMNEFIKEDVVDKETEIVIEIARELNDNNKRIAIERYQNERKNNREKYRDFLLEFKSQENLDLNVEESIPTFELWTEQIFGETYDEKGTKICNKNRIEIIREKEAIKRYELWTEQKGQCMYTGKMISLSKLFSNEIEIEHTIPRSILPDDTMANQTVCYARYNRNKKGKRIPTQCDNFDKDVDDWGTRIRSRLDNWKVIRDGWKNRYDKNAKPQANEDEAAKNKRIQEKHYCKLHLNYWKDKIKRFEEEEVSDNWARRQLVDTQMISKYAREFLKTYFIKVAVQKGTVTATFRKLFGFQDAEEIKRRNKHTHHAIDAMVLTLIPTNSSYRERILREYFEALENNRKDKIEEIRKNEIPQSVNVQKSIREIENSTLIYSYEKDTLVKQTRKIVRKRGKRQYLKDKKGNFILDKDGSKILLIAKGDTVRSELYARTYLGKIRDVVRDEDGKPQRQGDDWQYKTGKDEFRYVKRENIDKVKSSETSIQSIVDPVIRELVSKQKNNPEIKDSQGNIIRHVRVYTKAGKEVKNRINYLSKHDYKNKFYSEAGSIPYAILIQQHINADGVKREMVPVASYEIAKLYKQVGRFDIEKYINDFQPQYKDWNKKLLKVGQKVFVLKEDSEYEKRNDIDFQRNRLYVITQFSEGYIWLKYHLEATKDSDIDMAVKMKKDEILWKIEKELGLPEIKEDNSIPNISQRKKDFDDKKYRFDTIEKSYRLNRLSKIIGIKQTKEIIKSLNLHRKQSSIIGIDGETPPLLKMSKDNWNYLVEGESFEMNIDGAITFKE